MKAFTELHLNYCILICTLHFRNLKNKSFQFRVGTLRIIYSHYNFSFANVGDFSFTIYHRQTLDTEIYKILCKIILKYNEQRLYKNAKFPSATE